jgi:hypothetical protein
MFKKLEIILRNASLRVVERFPKVFGREFVKDTNIRVILALTGVLIITTWLIAFFRFQPSDYMVPIRYNSFLGVTSLGNWYDLYYVPGIMTLCFILNTYLGNVVYKIDKMVGYILLGANIFVSGYALIVVINLSLLANI